MLQILRHFLHHTFKSWCFIFRGLLWGNIFSPFIFSCEKQSLIPGCHYSLEDLTKPFPKCCPELICETQTQQQVIEQVQPTDTNKDRSIVAEKSTEEFLNNHKSFVEDHYINSESIYILNVEHLIWKYCNLISITLFSCSSIHKLSI